MSKLNKDDKGFSAVELLLVLVTLAIIGVAGYFVAKHVDKKTPITTNTSTSQTSSNKNSTTATNTYAGWQTYSGHGYTVEYPASWIYQDVTPSNVSDLTDVTFSNHSIMEGSDAPPYPIIDVTVFSDGYVYDSDSPAVSNNTDLSTFVRDDNGLYPTNLFSQVQQQTKTIAGAQAIKYEGGVFNTPWTMKVGSSIYQFTVENGQTNPIDNTTLQEYFNQFLASFQLN